MFCPVIFDNFDTIGYQQFCPWKVLQRRLLNISFFLLSIESAKLSRDFLQWCAEQILQMTAGAKPEYIVYTVKTRIYSVHCQNQNIWCTLSKPEYIECTVKTRIYGVHCQNQNIWCTLSKPEYIVYTVKTRIYSVHWQKKCLPNNPFLLF